MVSLKIIKLMVRIIEQVQVTERSEVACESYF